MKQLRLGTRSSELAVAQAESVARRLRALDCETELVKIQTAGDRATGPLSGQGGKALWVQEIEQAGELARSEALRAADRLPDSSPEAREALERLAEGIVAKLLHGPLERLRAEAAKGSGPYYADAVQALFGLEEDE